jgi:hypothetical protein
MVLGRTMEIRPMKSAIEGTRRTEADDHSISGGEAQVVANCRGHSISADPGPGLAAGSRGIGLQRDCRISVCEAGNRVITDVPGRTTGERSRHRPEVAAITWIS